MKTILTLLASCILSVSCAQNGKAIVMGKITDYFTNKILSGSTVILQQDGIDKYKAVTDSSGRFKISEAEPGVYSVLVTEQAYKTKRIDGFVAKGNIINFIDVELVDENAPSKNQKKNPGKKNRRSRGKR